MPPKGVLYFNGIGLYPSVNGALDGVYGMDGCSCGTGLGFVDPASVSIYMTALQTLNGAIDKIEDFLGIGQGRQEADLIVPTQNQITATVLAPISAEVQSVHALTCSELNSLLDQLNKAETKWLTFLHDPRWIDGRASVQAEATLDPYFDGLRKDLTDEIRVRCTGIIGSIGGGNMLVYAGLGVAALLLLRRK